MPRELGRAIEALIGRAAEAFEAYAPAASLLHGDLWGGNWSATPQGTPVVFDPAVYYGDRETDIAMTRLFGGFGAAFYEAYAEEWPLETGAERRVAFYNLYHLLNHFNLFGTGYIASVAAALEEARAALA